MRVVTFACAALTALGASQAPSPGPVRLGFAPGIDVATRLEREWTLVEVWYPEARPFRAPIPLDDYVRHYDTIAVVIVTGRHSALNGARDWAESRVEARVVDVLRQPRGGALQPQTLIAFRDTGGGVVTVGRAEVRFGLPWVRPYDVGQTYLVTLMSNQGPDLLSTASSGYLLRNGRLEARDRDPLSSFDGQTLADVRAVVRRVDGPGF